MPDTKINNQTKLLYGDLGYLINGILFKVHNELGRFAKEKQYANLIEIKLKESRINYKRELVIGDSGNVCDFNIDDKIIVELKAKPFLTQEDYSQVKRYLHQTGLELGILVNFRDQAVFPKRIVNIRHNL